MSWLVGLSPGSLRVCVCLCVRVYMCVHTCPGSGVRVYGNPLRPCFPLCVYLCLSLSSFARGVCDSCCLSSVCLCPSLLGRLTLSLFPLSSPLLPEASIQKECSLVRAPILFPSPASGFQVPSLVRAGSPSTWSPARALLCPGSRVLLQWQEPLKL